MLDTMELRRTSRASFSDALRKTLVPLHVKERTGRRNNQDCFGVCGYATTGPLALEHILVLPPPAKSNL